MPTPWAVLAAAAVIAGLGLAWRRRDAAPAARLALLASPLLLVALGYVYSETAQLSTRWTWSACRLAAALAWLRGYPLYSPVDHGPINGWLYGPVAAIAWLPAAVADSPRPALLIAAVINLLFVLAPLAAAARLAGRELPGTPLLLFTAAAAGLLQLYPTWYMASALHVDAVAAGLGAGSCLLLLAAGERRGRLWLAALLAVLAIGTKQTEAPLVLGQLAWLGLRRSRAAALHFAGAVAALLGLAAALAAAAFDLRDVVFNMWTVPSHHAWPGGWHAALAEVTDLARYTALLWIPCVALLAVPVFHRTEAPGLATPARDAVTLFFLAALALLPTGVLATIKVGGDRNSLHSVYFLIVAAVFAAAAGASALGRAQPGRAVAALLVIALLLAGLGVKQVAGYPHLPMLPARCVSQEAWAYARANPGTAYFPWDPLAPLLAEGRLYHFEYGVLDRILAGVPPTAARLAPDLPPAPRVVVYPKSDFPHTLLDRYLPGYTFARSTDDWLVFRASAPAKP